MTNRADIAERKRVVMNAAADRWNAHAPDIAAAAMRLARGGPAAASSPEQRERFVARESLKRVMPRALVGVERTIGTFDLDQDPPTDEARTAGRPVARIVELLNGGRIGEGFATGFLVKPELLITNWHVFPTAGDATGFGAQFGFERNALGLLEPGVVFPLDPSTFFLSDEALDIAIVAVAAAPAVGRGALNTFGTVQLIPTRGKILVGHPVSVIQHPDGRHKHWGVRENKLLAEPSEGDLFLRYTTDTLGGSSGSPAFNRDWELVAVHHSGVPRREGGVILTKAGAPWREGMADSEIDWIANEGVRVSKILERLSSMTIPGPSGQATLHALLHAATDPVLAEAGAVGLSEERKTTGNGAEGMNITVHGTANFYFGSTAAEPRTTLPTSTSDVSVTVEKKLRFDSDYAHRPGYVSTFLDGFDVPHPDAPSEAVLSTPAGKPLILDYHHYSLVMHKERRLAMWTAANVDYDPKKRRKSRDDFGTDTWKPDPRIPITAQIEDTELYEPARLFDRGHLVRRDDVAWGKTAREEEFGNSDSFHWTNCTPQHEGFNRDMFEYDGLWGRLENHIAKQAGFVENLLILFAGPVLSDDDEARDFGSGIEVQVPRVFWKVVVVAEETDQRQLRAYGFFLDQTEAIDEYGWEGRFKAGAFKEQQVSLLDITERTGVRFDDMLHEGDPLANTPVEGRGRRLRSLDQILLRRQVKKI